jgi:hypothetical protein
MRCDAVPSLPLDLPLRAVPTFLEGDHEVSRGRP